jgi:hypothetical protein
MSRQLEDDFVAPDCEHARTSGKGKGHSRHGQRPEGGRPRPGHHGPGALSHQSSTGTSSGNGTSWGERPAPVSSHAV